MIGSGQAVIGSLSIMFVTFLLMWTFIFKPRLDEIEARWRAERDRRIQLEDVAEAQVMENVKVVRRGIHWMDV